MKSLSFPKSKINVLLLEKLDKSAEEKFKKEGYNVEILEGSLDEGELIKKIKNISILGIRSKTVISKKVIDSAERLLSVGAFCIGTNQINLKHCSKNGIAVFNAPYSNTRSVVEIVIAQIINLLRSIVKKSNEMHDGKWSKDSINSHEIRNKTIGIIGYGNIGSQLSVLCESLGMNVLYFDRLDKLSIGNAKKVSSLHELLKESDIVSLHIDGSEENSNFISGKEFEMMKKDSILINYSRGNVVDINALKKYLVNNKLLGAAIDVFPKEPLNNSEKFDQSTATKIGKLLGAEMIITGTYFEMFGSLRIDAKLINVETGEIAFSVGADGAREQFFDLKNQQYILSEKQFYTESLGLGDVGDLALMLSGNMDMLTGSTNKSAAALIEEKQRALEVQSAQEKMQITLQINLKTTIQFFIKVQMEM